MWDAISSSNEIAKFLLSDDTKSIISRYSITQEELEVIENKTNQITEIDFSYLYNNIQLHAKTAKFYNLIKSNYFDKLNSVQIDKLDLICHFISNQKEIPQSYIDFSNSLIEEVRIEKPILFDTHIEENESLILALEFIIAEYNSAVENCENLESLFDRLSQMVIKKGLKYDSVFIKIGKQFTDGSAPTVNQIYLLAPSIIELKKLI